MVLVAAMFGPVLYGRISWLPMALISALHGLARVGLLEGGSRPPPGDVIAPITPVSPATPQLNGGGAPVGLNGRGSAPGGSATR